MGETASLRATSSPTPSPTVWPSLHPWRPRLPSLEGEVPSQVLGPGLQGGRARLRAKGKQGRCLRNHRHVSLLVMSKPRRETGGGKGAEKAGGGRTGSLRSDVAQSVPRRGRLALGSRRL